MRSSVLRAIAGACVAVCAVTGHTASPTQERVLTLCAQADGPAHCGRLIEAEQLKALPNLAVRNGDTLRVSLFPSGTLDFVDTFTLTAERSYALWDYWSPINAVVLFVTVGEDLSYAVLQRANGQVTALPAEPVLAPDRQRIAVADFCAKKCTNELTIWRVTRNGLRRELGWKPPAAWSDVTVSWKSGETLTIEYTSPGENEPRTLERRLGAPGWQRY
jgi:hypothetical protein